jgi:hypothetical protein
MISQVSASGGLEAILQVHASALGSTADKLARQLIEIRLNASVKTSFPPGLISDPTRHRTVG